MDFESVLNNWEIQVSRRVATFRDRAVVFINKERVVNGPDVNNGDGHMRHTVSSVRHRIASEKIIFFETFGFPSRTLVELREDTVDLVYPRILDLELNPSSMLLEDYNWDVWIVSFADLREEFNILWTFTSWQRLECGLGAGASGGCRGRACAG